jgi:recombinational DNA repair protein (RecF pathway)
MKDLIQQELEKLALEQLKQVFEFIAFLKFCARLVTNLAVDESNLATLYSEFAEEYRQLAELGMSEYAEFLKHEN